MLRTYSTVPPPKIRMIFDHFDRSKKPILRILSNPWSLLRGKATNSSPVTTFSHFYSWKIKGMFIKSVFTFRWGLRSFNNFLLYDLIRVVETLQFQSLQSLSTSMLILFRILSKFSFVTWFLLYQKATYYCAIFMANEKQLRLRMDFFFIAYILSVL